MAHEDVKPKSVPGTFSRLFFPMALLLVAGSILVYYLQVLKFTGQLSLKEQNAIRLLYSTFKNDLSNHMQNAVFLAETIRMKEAFLPESGLTGLLAGEFAEMMRIHPVYDQIRRLDRHGMEQIRINRSKDGPVIAPAGELQDKSGRYYFIEGMAGPRIYMSRFDLNVEHGSIEQPIKPMLRITAIVRDGSGNTEGLVVLNIKGRPILDRLKEIEGQMTGALVLLNSAGYWLVSPNPDDEWAFMYPEKSNRTFAAAHPGLWREISDKDGGQFRRPDGLVTFETVDMALPVSPGPGLPVHTAETWKIVSLVNSKDLEPGWRTAFISGMSTLLVLLAGICFFWARTKVNRSLALKALIQSEEKFRRVTRTMGDAVIMIDTHDRIRFWSESAERILGYTAREALGSRLHDLVVRGEERKLAQKGMAQFRSTGKGPIVGKLREAVALRKDGTRFPVEIAVTPLIQEDERFAVGVVRDITDRKAAETEKSNLLALTAIDGLTGIANRRCFDEVLLKEAARHSRSGAPLSLVLMDIDFFKAFNDTYGHVKGDKCLQQVARVMARCANRHSDLTARYGGEEFASILPETDNTGATAIAEKIREDIMALAIPHDASTVAHCITASLGVATVTCRGGGSAESVVSRADEQLYRAKTAGRNRVAVADLTGRDDLVDGKVMQLVWKDSFYCGHPQVDAQHKGLFIVANRLFGAILSDRPLPEISTLFNRLLDDLHRHFEDEEKILFEMGYPGAAHHAEEHARLLAKADAFSKSFEAPGRQVGDAFQFLVQEIVVVHMIGLDREYYPFIGDNNPVAGTTDA